MGRSARPAEDDPPLVVHPYAVKSSHVAAQRVKTVARWRSEVTEIMSGIEDIKLVQHRSQDVLRQAPNAGCRSAMEEICCGVVAKGCYH